MVFILITTWSNVIVLVATTIDFNKPFFFPCSSSWPTWPTTQCMRWRSEVAHIHASSLITTRPTRDRSHSLARSSCIQTATMPLHQMSVVRVWRWVQALLRVSSVPPSPSSSWLLLWSSGGKSWFYFFYCYYWFFLFLLLLLLLIWIVLFCIFLSLTVSVSTLLLLCHYFSIIYGTLVQ